MILNSDELNQLREFLDGKSGLDAELLSRCGNLLHMGNYDQAVHTAFVLLEERLRQIVGKPGMTGVAMINSLFSKNGRLTRYLVLSQKEQEKIRNLFDSAFSLYRNPSAHTVTNYDVTMGKAIIGLVNLLLLILGDPNRWPEPTDFHDNVEKAISLTEQVASSTAAQRLRLFLGHCIQLGIEPTEPKATKWVPFKRDALQIQGNWKEPRMHPLALFYLQVDEKKPGLYVLLNQHYSRVVDLNLQPLDKGLRDVGFRRYGKYRDFRVFFEEQNSQEFFNSLLSWLKETVERIDDLVKKSSHS